MTCDDCYLFHDGVLKGECRCNKCDCLWNYNQKLNEPIPNLTDKEKGSGENNS